MTEFNFKVGDKVYCPTASNGILTLDSFCRKSYPVSIDSTTFTPSGRVHTFEPNPSIFSRHSRMVRKTCADLP